MMKVFKKRRTYKLLFLIMAAALVYLGFQLFSVRLLTKQNAQTANHIVERHSDNEGLEKAEQVSKEKYVEDMEERKYHDKKANQIKPTPDMPDRQFHIPDIPEETLKFSPKPVADFPKKITKETDKLNLKKDAEGVTVKKPSVDASYPKLIKLRQSDVPRGVDPEKVGLYKPDAGGKFACLTSKVRFIKIALNKPLL
jgi:cell division protein FtsB